MAKHANIETVDEADLDEELVELEFDEESVSYYIVDEDDNEIGVCLIEDGEEVEYLYDDSQDNAETNIEADSKLEIDEAKREALKAQTQEVKEGIEGMKGELETFRDDASQVAGELKQTADELKGMLDDVKESFKIFPKKKK